MCETVTALFSVRLDPDFSLYANSSASDITDDLR